MNLCSRRQLPRPHLVKLRAPPSARGWRSLRPTPGLVPLVPLVGLLPPALRNCQKVDHPESFVLRNCGNTPKPPKAPRYSHWSLSHSWGRALRIKASSPLQRTAGGFKHGAPTGDVNKDIASQIADQSASDESITISAASS